MQCRVSNSKHSLNTEWSVTDVGAVEFESANWRQTLNTADVIVTNIRWFFNLWPVVGVLMCVIGCDIIMGAIAAFNTKSLSSSVTYIGGMKKVGILILVGFTRVIEPYTQGLPLANLTAMYYIWHESLSILENAARAGIALPPFLTDALQKLRGEKPSVASGSNSTIKVVHADKVELSLTSSHSETKAPNQDKS